MHTCKLLESTSSQEIISACAYVVCLPKPRPLLIVEVAIRLWKDPWHLKCEKELMNSQAQKWAHIDNNLVFA